MKGLILTLLIGLISLSGFSQNHDAEYWRRISKKEFKSLKENKLKFFPKDLKKEKVIIERLSVKELLELERKAFYASYYRNGIDTTITKPRAYNYASGEDSIKFINKRYGKIENYSEREYSGLYKKHFSEIVVLQSNQIKEYEQEYRYVIRKFYYTNKKDPKDVGWLMTYKNYVYDRKTGKSYDVFMPMNYSLFDLMKD